MTCHFISEMGNDESVASITKDSKEITYIEKGIQVIPPGYGADFRVEVLNLSRNRLQMLPYGLLCIKQLKICENKLEDLTGEVGKAIATYRTLEQLDLSTNKINGFPAIFMELTNLISLNLFCNCIKEFNCSLTKLTKLDIGHNQLKAIPSLPPNLKELSYDYNELSELNVSYPQLTKFTIALVGLNSIKPDLVFPNLLVFEAPKNNLRTVPDFTKFAPKIKKVDLSDNYLTEFPSFPMTINEINLKGNQIKKLPELIILLLDLLMLNVADNEITYIPSLPPQLRSLNTNGNKITQYNDCELRDLSKFQTMNNELIKFPGFHSNQATDIYFSYNHISKFDLQYFHQKITKVDLTSNDITEIPVKLFTFPKLTILILARNKITTIPNEIGNSQIVSFNISNNPLTELPAQWPPTLSSLVASYCGIKAVPPSLIANQCLQHIYLAGNELTEVPFFPWARILMLSRNKFVNFPKLSGTLETIDISCNMINAIPAEFAYAKLKDADFSYNNISEFPSNFTKTKLVYFKIRANPLECAIDPKIFPPSLQVLDISETKMTINGDIPFREVFVTHPIKSPKTTKIITEDYSAFSEMRGIRETMEDCVIVRAAQKCAEVPIDLFGVFDGHGGVKTATFCSHTFTKIFEQGHVVFEEKWLLKAVEMLVQNLKKKNFLDGATMAFSMVQGNTVISAHLGDARNIIIRNDGSVRFSTEDHKPFMRNEFVRIHSIGGRVQNNRTHGNLAVARSLGDFLVPGISSVPEISTINLEPTDKWLIICCDGIFDVLSNEYIGELSTHYTDSNLLAYDLRNYAFSNQSADNISVIVVDLEKRRQHI